MFDAILIKFDFRYLIITHKQMLSFNFKHTTTINFKTQPVKY